MNHLTKVRKVFKVKLFGSMSWMHYLLMVVRLLFATTEVIVQIGRQPLNGLNLVFRLRTFHHGAPTEYVTTSVAFSFGLTNHVGCLGVAVSLDTERVW